MLSSLNEESEGNALIQKLRMQSEENREKNEMTVRQKTLLNDQVGLSFVITFSLLVVRSRFFVSVAFIDFVAIASFEWGKHHHPFQSIPYMHLVHDKQSASFGPFDRQVVILNTDGKTFTLLQNPQAMRLKKAGYIEDRKFVIQPSQEVIDEALEGKNDLGEAIKGIFGGGGGDSEAAAAKKNVIESISDSVSEATSTGDVAEIAETK